MGWILFSVINGNCHFLKYLLCQANTYFFIFFKKFVEMQLVYNVVLISAAQQSNADIHIYTHYFSYSFPLWFITGDGIVPRAIQ